MTNRSVYLGLAGALFALLVFATGSGNAAPAPAVKVSAETALVQDVGYWKRRWWRRGYDGDERVRAPGTAVDTGPRGTAVEAPLTSVQTGRRGTWVRAPFVNLFVPR